MTMIATMVAAHPSLSKDYSDISSGDSTPYCTELTVKDEGKISVMYEFTHSGNTFKSAEPGDGVSPSCCSPLKMI